MATDPRWTNEDDYITADSYGRKYKVTSTSATSDSSAVVFMGGSGVQEETDVDDEQIVLPNRRQQVGDKPKLDSIPDLVAEVVIAKISQMMEVTYDASQRSHIVKIGSQTFNITDKELYGYAGDTPAPKTPASDFDAPIVPRRVRMENESQD